MNILVNFSSVRAGGGQQVAFNFMKMTAIKREGDVNKWFFVVGQGTFLEKKAKELGCVSFSVSYSYFDRVFNEKRNIQKICNKSSIDIILAFCPTPKISGVPVVLRTVYSNIYFPEVEFWKGLPKLKKLEKGIIDFFRKKSTFSSSALIFENRAMMQRATEQFGFPQDKCYYIAPSVTSFSDLATGRGGERQCKHIDEKNDNGCFKVLLLSSWHENKNFKVLPKVAALLEEKYEGGVVFHLTIPEDEYREFVSEIDLLGVGPCFKFLGTVSPEHVPDVVSDSSAMILLSKLECFSSNIVEAWSFERPLIISDEPWSRAECGSSVVYVDRDDEEEIAAAIYNLKENSDFYHDVVRKGVESLNNFNTPESKYLETCKVLRDVKAAYSTG